MEPLNSVTGPVVQYAGPPIGRQVGYLIFYNSNFKELTDHVKDLEGKRDEIKHFVEAERRNGKEIETRVQNWLEKVDGVIEEANLLQEDPRRAKVGCSGWSFPNLMFRHQLSRKATKMAKEVVDVKGKGKFDRVGHLPALDGVGSTSATRGSEKLESRKPIKEDIVQALRDPNVSKIGVYGLGGVGKTTLVKEVSQKAKDDKLFDAVVIAEVSQTPDLGRIQGEIADLLGLRFDEETLAGRACRLRERIKKEKTILVILDDIWTRLDLEKVGIPFGDEHNDLEKVGIPFRNEHNDLEKKQTKHYGCKILMTSRNRDMLHKMETQKDFRVEVLNEEETWSLFEVMAGDVVKDTSLQEIATEVARKCAGLPVRVVTVARALKNKDIYAWKDALKQLDGVDSGEMDAVTYSALELSYNWLEGDEIKAIFLLCAVLGSEIEVEYLLKCAMGLDIFKRINTVEDARNRFYKIIGSLKASCLLLENDTSEPLKMHDIVRDVGISIASRDQHVFVLKKGAELKEWPTKESLKRCPQINLPWCDISQLPERLDCPELKLFTLCSSKRSLKIPDTFFEGMESLKALGLTDMDIDSLPTSFHSLTNIRTLGLYRCTLRDIAVIGALKNLEILTLMKSSMTTLPIDIRQLSHLKLLNLSNSGIEFIPPNIISSLTKLEELYMGNTNIKWEVDNSARQKENASLAELRQLSNLTVLELQIREAWLLPRDLTFEKLERYKIVIGDVWEWSDIEDGTLKSLKLKLGTNIHLEHGIKTLIKRVENLYLDKMEGICNVLYQLNGEGFPPLKHLHIQNNAKIMYIIDSMEGRQAKVSFPNMETLVLHNLDNLEKICHGPLAVNSFGKLRIIKVENCIQLKYLLSFSMVKGLSQLSEVEVCQCNSMKKIVFADTDASADNDITVDKIEFSQLRSLTLKHLERLDNFFSNELTSSIAERKYPLTTYIPVLFSSKVAFPILETLKLSELNLNKIWDDNQHSFHKLTNLIVENCGGLKYLFSSIMVGKFLNLKHLEISKCHMMEEIIASEEGNNSAASEEIRFSKLETMILKDMEKLKTIWHHQFDTLKTLEIKNCEKVVVVFPSSMLRTYHNLETLVVTDCASVEEIFELTSNETSSKEDTIQLKKITLNGLPKLKHVWKEDPRQTLSFQNLREVFVMECKSLKSLFPLSIARDIMQIQDLKVYKCEIEEIVAKEEGTKEIIKFVFPCLTSLKFWNLPKLKGFYRGIHTLQCTSLKIIDVFNCQKLEIFKTESMGCQKRAVNCKLYESMHQPLFTIEEVLANLETLTLNNKDIGTILQCQYSGEQFSKLKHINVSQFANEEATFPYWFLKTAPCLELLLVEWSSFTEIFQDECLTGEEGQIGIRTRLKTLKLHLLHKLQHICKEGFQVDPVLQLLESIHVVQCSSLINLVPSSVTFIYLTSLEVANCNGLINLITSSTAKSLVKLTTMKIKTCNLLKDVVTEKEDETINEIAFCSLKILELMSLPRLSRFCTSKCFIKFPLLEKVVVKECPRMEIFSLGDTSIPNLQKVQIEENDEEYRWEGDLNGTIKKMFLEMVAFYRFKHLTLSEYRVERFLVWPTSSQYVLQFEISGGAKM